MVGVLSEGLLQDGRLLGAADSIDWRRQRKVAVAIGGRLRCGDDDVSVRVGLSFDFPISLPQIAIDDPGLLPLPHTEADGHVCYDRDANLVDRADPRGVLCECIERASATIHAAIHGSRAAEYTQEIDSYWLQLARRQLDVLVGGNDDVHPTCVILDRGNMIAIADDVRTYAQSHASRSIAHLTIENAVYIPVAPGRRARFEPRDLLRLDFLRDLVKELPAVQQKRLKRVLERCTKRREIVVLGVARPPGERSLVAIELGSPHGHPLAGQVCTVINPIRLQRRDQPFLFARGGAVRSRSRANVLLVGCGAIGGYLAVSLARAGVGRIGLVDNDFFTLENALRHVVGMAYVRTNKADALATYLRQTVPFVTATPFAMTFQEFAQGHPDPFDGYDLILCATGHPTLELTINDLIWSDPSSPPALFTWLEPLGIGGHAVLTHAPDEQAATTPGCLGCLYQRPVKGGGPLVNEAAFANPSETYTSDLLGCGSSFLPYGDLDATRTAQLAAKVALEALDGHRVAATLASWKGSDREFVANGFSTTPRYATCATEEVLETFSPGCRACAVSR